MKPSLVITFIVAGALSILGIIASAIDSNVAAAVWAFCTLLWILIDLHFRVDLETQKRINNNQEEIIETQEEIIRIQKETIKCQKEIIKELEQKQ